MDSGLGSRARSARLSVMRITPSSDRPLYRWRRIAETGSAAMSAIAAPKSRTMNWLEGVTLCAPNPRPRTCLEGCALAAILQALPPFTGAALFPKTAASIHIAPQPGSAAFFVLTTSILYAMLTPYVAAIFPRLFGKSYEPLFFDASLSFPEKVLRWRTQPMASLHLPAHTIIPSRLPAPLWP